MLVTGQSEASYISGETGLGRHGLDMTMDRAIIQKEPEASNRNSIDHFIYLGTRGGRIHAFMAY